MADDAEPSIFTPVLMGQIRTVLATVGGGLVAHGYINDSTLNLWIGIVMALVPVVWSAYSKFNAEKKTAVREVAAVNAGVAVAATGAVGPTVRPADVPEIIKDFAPPQTPKEPT